jgi:Mrp family chromosome partitioning ATPase/capsular polysaccharide biosynthesis protein
MQQGEPATTETVTVGDYLEVLRRRRWFIVSVAVSVFLIGVLLTLGQSSAYRATARAILPQSSATPGSTAAQLQRSPVAEASLARQPAIAAEAIEAADADLSTDEFLADSTVKADEDADVLEFTVTATSAASAVALANAYATEFDRYRARVAEDLFESARRRIQTALNEVETELEAAGADGDGLSTTEALLTQQYQELLEEQQRLLSTQALASGSLVTIPAERAVKAGGNTLRTALLALGLGVVLGIILAFIREALDPRVGSADEIGDRLGLPLLARVPQPPRRVSMRNRIVMLEAPAAPQAEAFRVLRTNLEFANASFGGRTVLVAAAAEGDGGSTTLANLGVALARSGRSVMLADFNLRAPRLGALFGLERSVGVTDVALKRVDLDDALVQLGGTENEDPWSEVEGELRVLPAGSLPQDPGDLIGTQGVADVLRELGERSEFVLVDSAPLLSFADGVALSARVDAIIVVVPLHMRRPQIDELRRMLDVCPAAKLGYVLTERRVEAPGTRSSASSDGAGPSPHRAPAEAAKR